MVPKLLIQHVDIASVSTNKSTELWQQRVLAYGTHETEIDSSMFIRFRWMSQVLVTGKSVSFSS